MVLITPDDVKRDIKCPRRRSLAAMIKKVVAGENTRHRVNGRLPEALSSAAIFAYYFHHQVESTITERSK